MPSARGSAPPDSDVPAPRGTTGTPVFARIGEHRRDLLRGTRQDRDERLLAIGGQCVAVERGEAGRIGHHAIGHDAPSAATMSAPWAMISESGW